MHLKTSYFEDENAFSNECVPASGKLGLAPVLYTLNNSFDLVLRDQHQYLLQHCIEGLGVS